jgi:hydroxymethylbilane synthase
VSKLRIGTRNSRLAKAQTQQVGAALQVEHPDLDIEYVGVTTEGDLTTTPLWESPVAGVFVSRLREELLAHRVDVIVHSMKDLPAAHHDLVVTACVPLREDPRDVLVSRGSENLMHLPPGSRVGTSSPRRTATIRRHRDDLVVESIRGNIDTRIDKVMRGDYYATVLALAGLIRAGMTEVISHYLPHQEFLPAPRQGALAIECRAGDDDTVALFAPLHDRVSALTSEAERALLLGLRAGCSTALGALATWEDGTLSLTAELSVAHTGESARLSQSAPIGVDESHRAHNLGLALAAEFREMDIYQRASWS